MKKRKTALILYNLLIDDKRPGVGVMSVVKSFMYTRRSLKYFASPCSLVCYILSCNRVEKGHIDLEVSGLEKDPEMEYKAISSLVKEISGYRVSGVTVSINGNLLNL
jgi:hypothetical protein